MLAEVTETMNATDWLGVCRRAVDGLARLLDGAGDTDQRAIETGTRGAGGDRTLVLDRSAEEIVFAELETIHAEGVDFTAISEERGEQAFGDGHLRVVIDPIDGSLNAKRDALHYSLSVAVADGETMADVGFAFVHDFGAREQWWAIRGEGAWHAPALRPQDARRLDPTLGARRSIQGKLELLAIENADPRWVRDSAEQLVEVAHRLRALGTIAVALCQVAAARYDGLVTLKHSRGVDAAAGQLIVREAGGLVAFPDCAGPLAAALDATASSRLIAARDEAGLRALEAVGA
jgi:myo-inositol-1(or 4)-monophosphatase